MNGIVKFILMTLGPVVLSISSLSQLAWGSYPVQICKSGELPTEFHGTYQGPVSRLTFTSHRLYFEHYGYQNLNSCEKNGEIYITLTDAHPSQVSNYKLTRLSPTKILLTDLEAQETAIFTRIQ